MIDLSTAGPTCADPPGPGTLALAFTHAPAAMAVVDAEDEIVEVNAALCRLAGLAHDDLCGRRLADLVQADHPEAAGRAVEGTLTHADGRRIEVLVVGTALPSPGDGTPEQSVVQVTDVSEQKRALRDLRRSNAELSSFAFLAAHELKSPLQSMSGFAALLERVHGPQLDPQGREFIGWIVDSAARMDVLVEALLAYCAVDTAEPVLAPVSLDDVVATATAELHADIAARGATVVADPLPEVDGDAVQLGVLLHNLLANAVKFVPDGQAPHVHVGAERAAEAWLLTVADDGIGVDSAASARIFAMFERLHPRERFQGTGIGLSICKRIVERRGGTIWVEPNAGAGSRFRFSLPDVVTPAGRNPAEPGPGTDPRP